MKVSQIALCLMVGAMAMSAMASEDEIELASRRCACAVGTYIYDESSLAALPGEIPYYYTVNNKILSSKSPEPVYFMLVKSRINKGIKDYSCENTQYFFYTSSDKAKAEAGEWDHEMMLPAENAHYEEVVRDSPEATAYVEVVGCHSFRTPI